MPPGLQPAFIGAVAGGGDAAALAGLRGAGGEPRLVALLPTAEAKVRPLLVKALGQRRAGPVVPELLKLAADPDKATRHAAIEALGATIGASGLPALAAMVVKPARPEDVAAAETAFSAAARARRAEQPPGEAVRRIPWLQRSPHDATC